MNVLEKIMRAASAHGIDTDAAFAEFAGLPNNRIWRWREGSGEPSWSEVVTWARRFNLPLEYLADDASETPDAQWMALQAYADRYGWRGLAALLVERAGEPISDPIKTGDPVPLRSVEQPEAQRRHG